AVAYLANIKVLLGCLSAATRLHKNMLLRMLRAPMHFFDTTPMGRIVNRFSDDTDVLDTKVTKVLMDWLTGLYQVFSALIVMSTNMPMVLTVITPLAIIYMVLQRVHAGTARQLKRLRVVSKSPIVSNFSETLSGLSTIRAFNVQHQFLAAFEKNLDKNQATYFAWACTNR
ncbi:unnamed protein product, partial [Allacma fusca]